MIFGYSINHAPMPYAVLEHLVPQLKLSGDPNRLIVMSFLAASVLSSIVLAQLDLTKRKGRILIGVFFAVLFIELWPATLPKNVAAKYPEYVNHLAKLPAGAVVDDAAINQSWQLYDQTITNKPIAFGYISRTPTSVANKDWVLTAAILRNQYASLCSQYGIRYFTTPASRPLNTTFPVVYRGKSGLIYDLKDSSKC